MPLFAVAICAAQAVPRTHTQHLSIVDALSAAQAEEQERLSFGQRYPVQQIVAVRVCEVPVPMADEATAEEAERTFQEAAAAWREAKVQVWAAQGRCRAAKRAMIVALVALEQARGHRVRTIPW